MATIKRERVSPRRSVVKINERQARVFPQSIIRVCLSGWGLVISPSSSAQGRTMVAAAIGAGDWLLGLLLRDSLIARPIWQAFRPWYCGDVSSDLKDDGLAVWLCLNSLLRCAFNRRPLLTQSKWLSLFAITLAGEAVRNPRYCRPMSFCSRPS